MEDWHEHIDEYMAGSLKGEELIAFEKEVMTNASLRAAIDNYEDAKKISEGLLEVDMLETLAELKMKNEKLIIEDEENLAQKDEGVAKSAKVFNLRFLMSAAAMVGIVVFAGWWMYGPMGNSLDRDKILAEYTRPVNEDRTKSVDTLGMSPFQKGMHFFDLNQFEESERWLKFYLSEETDKKMRSRGHFWLGAAHLEQWEVDEAREAWEESEEEGVIENLKLLEDGKKK